MKIYKDGELLAEIPSEVKNFECYCHGGAITIVIDNAEVKLATYSSHDKARGVAADMLRAYLTDTEEFNLPNE